MQHNFVFKKLVLLGFVAFTLNSRISSAQQSVSVVEKTASAEVAKTVEHVRKQNRLPRIKRIDDHHVLEDACSRAKRGDDSYGERYGGTGDKVGTLSVLWYSTVDPNLLQPELVQLAKEEDHYEQPHRFAVGVCFVAKTGSTDARYWVEVRTYMGAVKSFFYHAVWD